MELISAFKSSLWQENVFDSDGYFKGVHSFSAQKNECGMSDCRARTRFQESNHLCMVFDRFCTALPISKSYRQHHRVYGVVLATISQNQRHVFKILGW